MPGFQVWLLPGGLIWKGADQEEPFSSVLSIAGRVSRPGIVVELYAVTGEPHLRRVAYRDDGEPTHIPTEP